MSQENMERTRAVIEDFISGKGEFDTEGMLTKMPDEVFFDPEIEWDASEVPVLDIRGVYRGIEAVRQYWREWFAAWEIVHFEFELVDAGERIVALFNNQRMRGRSTGIEVPVGKYATVSTIRDGRLVHWKLYMSQSEALEAVGLSEQAMSQENVELAYRSIDAINRRDLAAYLTLADDDIEAVSRLAPIEGGYHGHDGIRRWWETLFETWPDFTARVVELRPVGDLTLGTLLLRAHGAGSDIPSDWTVCSVARWRGGKCVWWGNFRTRGEALEAVGLSEDRPVP
jgi:ketosteroid isomerase-like protein